MIRLLSSSQGLVCGVSRVRVYHRGVEAASRFLSQLKEEVEGDVGIDTIDWMWDEIEQLSVHGGDYSEVRRPKRPDVLEPVRNCQQ